MLHGAGIFTDIWLILEVNVGTWWYIFQHQGAYYRSEIPQKSRNCSDPCDCRAFFSFSASCTWSSRQPVVPVAGKFPGPRVLEVKFAKFNYKWWFHCSFS